MYSNRTEILEQFTVFTSHAENQLNRRLNGTNEVEEPKKIKQIHKNQIAL